MLKPSLDSEFVTILAPTAEEALREFKRQGLGDRGYLIAGQMARHRFSVVEGEEAHALDNLSGMVVVTFRRS